MKNNRAFLLAIYLAMFAALATVSVAKSGKTVATRGPASPPIARPVPITAGAPSFVVGVWYQPVSSFNKWRDRGINTLIGLELEGGAVTAEQYIDKAHAMGFWVIANHPKADMLLNGPDEPDGVGNTPPAAWVANYKALKAQYPGKLVFGNFDGEKTRWRPEADYAQPGGYLAGVDVAGMDKYVVNAGLQDEGGWDIFTSRVDFLVRVAAGKPVFVAIECSDQDLRVQSWLHTPENQPQGDRWARAMRCPTPDEVEREAAIATEHGARGIFYFPDVVGNGWEGFDGTPEEVAIRMRAINLRLVTPTGPPPPTKGPLDGKTMTVDGFNYTITSRTP